MKQATSSSLYSLYSLYVGRTESVPPSTFSSEEHEIQLGEEVWWGGDGSVAVANEDIATTTIYRVSIPWDSVWKIGMTVDTENPPAKAGGRLTQAAYFL